MHESNRFDQMTKTLSTPPVMTCHMTCHLSSVYPDFSRNRRLNYWRECMKNYYLLLMTGSKETQCYSGKDSHGAEKEEEDLVISRGLVYDVCLMMMHYHSPVS